MVSEIRVNNQIAKTEENKRNLIDAQKDAAQGVITIPGLGTVPINRVAELINNAKNVNKPKINFSNSFRTGKPNYGFS